MNKELQSLIDIAKDGGTVTPKQREIILRKAQQLGEDLDEVEMILESIKAKQIAKEPEKAIEKRMKCPNCGAVISDTSFACPDCGYVLQHENKASLEARAMIAQLRERLAEAEKTAQKPEYETPSVGSGMMGKVLAPLSGVSDSVRRKASVVNTFTMPTTKEGLIQFLEFSYSNYISFDGIDYGTRVMKEAWYGKTMQAYNTLARIGENDPGIQSILNKYSSLVSKEEKHTSTKKKTVLILIVLGVLFFLVLDALIIIFADI